MSAKKNQQAKKAEPQKNTAPAAPAPVQKTDEELEKRGRELEGKFIDKNCPRCNAKLLGNEAGDEWCSNVQCDFGIVATPPAPLTAQIPPSASAEQDRRETIPIQIWRDTHAKMVSLKDTLEQSDFNAVITALIDNNPGKKSTEDEVTLVMPRQKFNWLMAWQRNTDCTELLKGSVR